MTPQEFLAEAQERWRHLPDSALSDCDDESRAFVREIEAQGAEMEFAALSDLIMNCHNKYQFAKTYKVLTEDLRTMDSHQANFPNLPEQVGEAVKAAMKLAVEQKLSEMEYWFVVHFADSHDHRQMQRSAQTPLIETYSGQGSGCAGAVLFALVAWGMMSFVVFKSIM